MVKGGVIKIWILAISEFFTTPWYRKMRVCVEICIPLINRKYCMRMEWKNHSMDFCQVEQFDFKNRPIKHAKYTKKYVAESSNVYLKLSVAAWWSTVAHKTHAKYPYCEPVLLRSKVVTWYLHFSEELEVEVESVEKPKIYFSGKVYCRGKTDMITAFFWGIRGGEGKMIVHVATRGRYELVQF